MGKRELKKPLVAALSTLLTSVSDRDVLYWLENIRGFCLRAEGGRASVMFYAVCNW